MKRKMSNSIITRTVITPKHHPRLLQLTQFQLLFAQFVTKRIIAAIAIRTSFKIKRSNPRKISPVLLLLPPRPLTLKNFFRLEIQARNQRSKKRKSEFASSRKSKSQSIGHNSQFQDGHLLPPAPPMFPNIIMSSGIMLLSVMSALSATEHSLIF